MTGDEAAALGLLAFALVSAFLLAMARSALAMTVVEPAEEGARRGPTGGWLPNLLRRADQALPGMTATRYLLGGLAILSASYLLAAQDRVSWVPLALAMLALFALLGSIPKLAALAARGRERAIASTLAPVLWPLVLVEGPFVALAQWATLPLRKPKAPAKANGNGEYHGPETQILIPVDEDATPPDERDLRMIQAILDMEQRTARDVMVPRVDLVAVDVEESVAHATALMVGSGHRRILVFEDTIDRVIGILHARDLLPLVGREAPTVTLRGLLRPAAFIPENKRLDALLPELLRRRVHIAVVVDEYGGTAGLVTLADVLEEIVGEIVDEFFYDKPEVVVVNDNEVLLDARVHLDYLKDHFSVSIDADGFDTVGGLLYSELGKIPSPGDVVTTRGLRLQVLTTLGMRVKRVRVERLSPQEA